METRHNEHALHGASVLVEEQGHTTPERDCPPDHSRALLGASGIMLSREATKLGVDVNSTHTYN